MKSNPAVPRGSFESKPTWPNTFGCSATSAFFVLVVVQASRLHDAAETAAPQEFEIKRGGSPMKKLDPTMAQPIAQGGQRLPIAADWLSQCFERELDHCS